MQRGRSRNVGRNEEAVLAVAQQIVRRSDTVGEHERQPGRGGFVDDHAPRLLARQQREDVGVDIALRELLLAETAGDRDELDACASARVGKDVEALLGHVAAHRQHIGADMGLT